MPAPVQCLYCRQVVRERSEHEPLCYVKDLEAIFAWTIQPNKGYLPTDLDDDESRRAVDLLAAYHSEDEQSVESMLLHWNLGYWRQELSRHLALQGTNRVIVVDVAELDTARLGLRHPQYAVNVIAAAQLLEGAISDLVDGMDDEGVHGFALAAMSICKSTLEEREQQRQEYVDPE